MRGAGGPTLTMDIDNRLTMTGGRKCPRLLARGCVAAALACGALPFAGHAAGLLENPSPATAVSGIGVISGWHCTASKVEIEFDGGARLLAGGGTDRLDAAATCGKRNVGFGLLLNWAVLGAGTHTIRALADGVEFGRASVNVVTLGSEFVTGKTAATTIPDFPSSGKTSVLEWREAEQRFAITEVRNEAPMLTGRWNGANLEKRSGCASAQNNGNHGTYAEYNIGIEGGFIGIDEQAITGLHCSYSGPYRQDGTRREISGSYTCSDGKRGDFTATSVLVTPGEMSLRLAIKLNTSETCSIDAILGGSRF